MYFKFSNLLPLEKLLNHLLPIPEGSLTSPLSNNKSAVDNYKWIVGSWISLKES